MCHKSLTSCFCLGVLIGTRRGILMCYLWADVIDCHFAKERESLVCDLWQWGALAGNSLHNYTPRFRASGPMFFLLVLFLNELILIWRGWTHVLSTPASDARLWRQPLTPVSCGGVSGIKEATGGVGGGEIYNNALENLEEIITISTIQENSVVDPGLQRGG